MGIFGLLIAVYGLDVHEPFSSQLFFLGVVCAESGGIIVWLSNRKQNNSTPTQKYDVTPNRLESESDPVKYRNIYDGSPVLQRTVNTAGIILECNQVYVKNFGSSKEDVLGK